MSLAGASRSPLHGRNDLLLSIPFTSSSSSTFTSGQVSATASTSGGSGWSSSATATTSALDPQSGKTKKQRRQQFTACTACRLRRVKCDLKERQNAWDALVGSRRSEDGEAVDEVDTPTPIKEEEDPLSAIGAGMAPARPLGTVPVLKKRGRKSKAEKQRELEEQRAGGLTPGSNAQTALLRKELSLFRRRSDVACKNCTERQVVCVDEFRERKMARSQQTGRQQHREASEQTRAQTHSSMEPTTPSFAYDQHQPSTSSVTPVAFRRPSKANTSPTIAPLLPLSPALPPTATPPAFESTPAALDDMPTLLPFPAGEISRPNTSTSPASTTLHIPDLSPAFLDSAFYRRFYIQRPILDPQHFAKRYLATDPIRPRAEHMGVEGAILCHIICAWACSYGVDEHGRLDMPELSASDPGLGFSMDEYRERARQRRRQRTDEMVRMILKEIDDAAIMRRHTWDGVRCLLLILPLTEYVATPMERLAMYEAATAQVFSLCSLSAIGYDGESATLGPDAELLRVRLYWYSFVHEGITTGLKGGRLVLDEDDLETFQHTLPNTWGALVPRSMAYKRTARFATAPIRLALACRLIHKALTGPKARRRETVDKQQMNEAWEALENCWNEFGEIGKEEPPSYLQREDVVRFSDGWVSPKCGPLRAHVADRRLSCSESSCTSVTVSKRPHFREESTLTLSVDVIRESLEHRVKHQVPKPAEAFLVDLSLSSEDADGTQQMHRDVQTLHRIAQDKCEKLTRQIVEIVKAHQGTSFFEWDASLVRDGVYYAASYIAREGGPQEDLSECLAALQTMRWGYAKAEERCDRLRDLFVQRQAESYSVPQYVGPNTALLDQNNTSLPPPDALFSSLSGLGPNIGGFSADGMLADTASINISDADFLSMMMAYGDFPAASDFSNGGGSSTSSGGGATSTLQSPVVGEYRSTLAPSAPAVLSSTLGTAYHDHLPPPQIATADFQDYQQLGSQPMFDSTYHNPAWSAPVTTGKPFPPPDGWTSQAPPRPQHRRTRSKTTLQGWQP